MESCTLFPAEIRPTFGVRWLDTALLSGGWTPLWLLKSRDGSIGRVIPLRPSATVDTGPRANILLRQKRYGGQEAVSSHRTPKFSGCWEKMGGRKFLPWVQRIAALGAFLVLSLSSAQATDPSAVIAHIGKTEIHASEIQPLVAVLDPQAQAALAQDPTKLQQFVRSALVQRMLLQEALAKKWDQQPAVQEQLRQARENKLVDTYVQAIAKVPDVYPDEAEIQSAYDQAKDSLLAPRQYRLAQIFVAAPKITDPIQLNLAQSRMESLQKELQKPNADFAALATARSEDMASAVHGGEIGWLTENQVQPDMRSQFTSLRKGTTSPPIRLLDGWHFLKCMDIKEPYTLSLAEVKSQLIQELRTQRARAIAKDYVDNLVQSAPLTIDEASVRKVLKP